MECVARMLAVAGLASAMVACGGGGDGYIPEDTPGVFERPMPATTTSLIFSQLDMGLSSACGMTADGATYCWGSNAELQLGSNGPFQRCDGHDCSDTPLRVAGIPATAMVAVGFRHACAVARTGETHCWGRGTSGELGDGVAHDSVLPLPVQTTQRFLQISAGAFTCGLTAAQEIYCWGAGGTTAGVGSGSGGNAMLPVRIASNLPFTSVSVGDYNACAVAVGGDVYCWGLNQEGQLGTGNETSSAVPSLVSGALAGLDAASVNVSGDHGCALAEQRAYCWGRKIATGEPDATNPQLTPIAVRTDLRFLSISAGLGYNCAIATDNVAWCWGEHEFYTLGDGSADDRRTPQKTSTDARFSSVAAGSFTTCALTTAGQPYCWGINTDGQALRPGKL